MPTRIGILDSGVGGLSVLLEITQLLPHADIIYIGDSSWCPYGTKSPVVIQNRVTTLSKHLIQQGANIIVIACNSATIHAVESVREHFDIPFVGMEPAVKPAAQATSSNIIGVLATEASIAGEKFHHLIHTHAPASKIKVITHPCPKFVDLVEAGTLAGSEVDAAIRDYTTPMLLAGADTLVLGCTHYPFLRESIQRVVGDDITLIDTGAAVAKRTQSLLSNKSISSSNRNVKINIHTTGNLDLLETIFPTLCPSLQTSAQLKHLSLP
ncbi:MAG: glutamate racemase [Cryomorphaceae bacterium]|jgi:glutamate racemase